MLYFYRNLHFFFIPNSNYNISSTNFIQITSSNLITKLLIIACNLYLCISIKNCAPLSYRCTLLHVLLQPVECCAVVCYMPGDGRAGVASHFWNVLIPFLAPTDFLQHFTHSENEPEELSAWHSSSVELGPTYLGGTARTFNFIYL